VKSSLWAVNNTLTDVEHNEQLLKEGIQKITSYMDTFKVETRKEEAIIGVKIEIEGHILKVITALKHCSST
jgi:hypothetical protein